MDTCRPLPGRRTGFSLLETLIVLSVLGIVLAVALPSYTGYASTQRARAAAHVLASDLRVAQQEAMTRRGAITVAFFAADASCSGTPPSYVIGDPRAAIKRACLPTDVTWSHGSGPEASGPVLSLLLAMCGRKAALADLSGDGTEVLSARP